MTADSQARRPEGCSGSPSECGHVQRLLLEAADGFCPQAVLDSIRSQLGHCPPCLHALEVDLSTQKLVALHCREQAPESLQIRISETLQRIELDSLDFSDLNLPLQDR